VLQVVHRVIRRVSPRLYNPLLSLYLRFFDFESRRIRKAIKQSLANLTEESPSRFVSVGTNDGFSNDPFVSWVLTSDCEASFIEPVPDVFNALKANYQKALGFHSRLSFHQVAISNFTGTTKFYAVSPEAKNVLGETIPPWFNQLGSFDKSHIEKHLDGVLEPFIYSMDIETYSLNDFLRLNNVGKLDVLHIDAEGHDYKIIESLNMNEYQPSIILIEHKHLTPEEKLLLLAKLSNSSYKIREFRSDLLATKITN